MYIPNYPEDSTLRRHYDSAARFRREAHLVLPPGDSVLNRHYRQLHAAGTAASSASPRPQEPSAAGGGFLGWLRRLFS